MSYLQDQDHEVWSDLRSRYPNKTDQSEKYIWIFFFIQALLGLRQRMTYHCV